MDQQRASRAPLIIAVSLLLLPALYLGSYLMMVAPGGLRTTIRFGPGPADRFVSRSRECYRMGGVSCRWLYAPLEWIDRRVRPAAWEEEFWSEERTGRVPILPRQ